MTQLAFNDGFSLRIYRARSWLAKAAVSTDDDMRFIALWIAFNAAYARELPELHTSDRGELTRFLGQVCQLDTQQQIYRLLWQKFSGSIRLLLDNRYVFQPFWDYHNGLISETAWKDDFSAAKQKINQALKNQDTHKILMIIFERIYTLRNQIVHGGASYNSSANRNQVRDASALLAAFVPLMLEIMEEYPDHQWGKPFYPFIAES